MFTDQSPIPSTHDARIAGGQDGVLICLQNARERYARDCTCTYYAWPLLGGGLSVCAVGALYVEDVTPYALRSISGVGDIVYAHIEHRLREDTKKAIAALNQAALALCPESADYSPWQGPAEWINQELPAPRKVILSVYDLAIEMQNG